MGKKHGIILTKILTVVTFLGMVAVNALANILPINGVNTGQVSDSFKNLFAPAGLTFAIWGLIYFLLAMYTLFQLRIFRDKQKTFTDEVLAKVGLVFSISSLANIVWILTWHYNQIPITMVLMIVILVCLIYIVNTLKKENLSKKAKIFVMLPFSVYFGWITVAAIANATTLLVYLGWDGFGMPQELWTILVLIVGLLIAVATILKNHDAAYGLVIVWAFAGILVKHFSADGFAGLYPEIYAVVIICIVLLLIAIVNVLLHMKKEHMIPTEHK